MNRSMSNRTRERIAAIRGYVLPCFLLVVVCLAGCARRASAPNDGVKYGKGFYGEERGSEGTWRWMSDEGVVRLRNTNRDTLLKVEGRVPAGKFATPPKVAIKLNGQVVEEFSAPKGKFRKDYTITPAQQGSDDWSELKFSTSVTIVPKDVDPKSNDTRKLGFKLHELAWDSK